MIAATLRAMADDVEARATITTWDVHRQPTEEQQATKADKVRSVARAFRVLAEDAETRSVRYAEFETLKDRLYAFGFAIDPRLMKEVASAFHDAEGPAKPRSPGWLKQR